ncbi:hypothetical protein P4544_07750 [Halomonas sp. LY9]
MEMIKQLKSQWKRARDNNTFPAESGDQPQTSLANWQPDGARVILSWHYIDKKSNLDEDNVAIEIPGYENRLKNLYIKDYLDFAPDDDIQKGDWLLCWAARADGKPDKRKKESPFWLHVNKVISHGIEDKDHEYSLLAAELKAGNTSGAKEPFNIDSKVKMIAKNLLQSDDYQALKPSEHQLWRYKNVHEENYRFLRHLQQVYCNELS